MKWQLKSLTYPKIKPERPLKKKVPMKKLVIDSRNQLFSYQLIDKKFIFTYVASISENEST